MPYFMSKDFYTGYGWYHKTFSLSDNDLSKKIFIEFDGVFQEAKVLLDSTETNFAYFINKAKNSTKRFVGIIQVVLPFIPCVGQTQILV